MNEVMLIAFILVAIYLLYDVFRYMKRTNGEGYYESF
jgi:hypothetical protein